MFRFIPSVITFVTGKYNDQKENRAFITYKGTHFHIITHFIKFCWNCIKSMLKSNHVLYKGELITATDIEIFIFYLLI